VLWPTGATDLVLEARCGLPFWPEASESICQPLNVSLMEALNIQLVSRSVDRRDVVAPIRPAPQFLGHASSTADGAVGTSLDLATVVTFFEHLKSVEVGTSRHI
jgi:hypothetical protein